MYCELTLFHLPMSATHLFLHSKIYLRKKLRVQVYAREIIRTLFLSLTKVSGTVSGRDPFLCICPFAIAIRKELCYLPSCPRVLNDSKNSSE